MAEIPIERKKGGPGWLPWLLGLLLLLALGYCFMRRGDGTATADSANASGAAVTDSAAIGAGAAAGAAAGTVPTSGGGAVEQFAQFVAQRDTANETEGQHQYTAEGVRRLAAALEETSGGASIQAYADSMRRSVDRLQRSSSQDGHADDAKAAFSAAVSAMASIDQARGRARDVAPMRAIYGELKSEQPLVPQLGTVHRFFEAARDALQAAR